MKRTCLALFLAFCVPLPTLIPSCGLVSVWKHIGSCGKRCVGGNVDHASEKTPNFSNTISILNKNWVFDPSRDKNFDFFPSLKNFPFPSLSHFLSGWVLGFGEPSLSFPNPLPPACVELPPLLFYPMMLFFHALLKNLVFTCILQIIWNKGFVPSFLLVSVNLLSNCLILNSFLVVLQKPKAVCALR